MKAQFKIFFYMFRGPDICRYKNIMIWNDTRHCEIRLAQMCLNYLFIDLKMELEKYTFQNVRWKYKPVFRGTATGNTWVLRSFTGAIVVGRTATGNTAVLRSFTGVIVGGRTATGIGPALWSLIGVIVVGGFVAGMAYTNKQRS